tara:strand:- start:347 stop:487 length:141 start_codon:yes stop_codon:yes gene_type:complete
MINNINKPRAINKVSIDSPVKIKTPINFIKDEVKPIEKKKRKSSKK